MNEPKLATARVDAERLVRELISAFNSLKTRLVSDIDGSEPEQISVSESVENSETGNYQIEAQSGQRGIIEDFRSDSELIERLRVTPQEL